MTTELQGKRCFVNAAGQGIGRAIATALHDAGGEVLASDRDQSLLDALHADTGIETVQLDVTDAAAIAALGDRLSQVDVLCQVAGFVHDGTLLDVDDAAYDFSFALNVRSAFRMAQAVVPGMRERRHGSIIIVSSVVSSIKGAPRRCVYGATKAALLGLSKSIAADYVTEGIRSNCICPGTVETPSWHGRVEAQGGDLDAVRAAFVARQPMGRLGTAEEIAAIALYLAADESAYTTGQVFVVDGGITI
jgi:2-keto-3-deoxy-L-fuconate dehydrogenase